MVHLPVVQGWWLWYVVLFEKVWGCGTESVGSEWRVGYGIEVAGGVF